MEKTVPTRALEALTGLSALELDIRNTVFLANCCLGPEFSDSLWDQEIAACVTVDIRRVGYDRSTRCLPLRKRY